MSFVVSDALFPPLQLRRQIEPDYLRECRLLFVEPAFPSFTRWSRGSRGRRHLL